MKKYFLMLVVALAMPLLFTSCGDDDKDKGVEFPYSTPNLNWGSSMTSVKASMQNSGISLFLEDAYSLVYSNNGEYPMYTYIFDDDELESSALELNEEQAVDYNFYGWLCSKYGNPVDEEDGDYTFVKNSLLVLYEHDADARCWIASWMAYDDDDTRADVSLAKEVVAKHKALVRKARN